MPLKENYDRSQEVTWDDLAALRKHLDSLWVKIGVDIDFSHHFAERINDPRNKRQITVGELEKLLTETFKKYASHIAAKVTPGADHEFEAVLHSISSKLNLPFVLFWDRRRRELVLRAKTIMRKDNFYTPDPKLVVQNYDPGKHMKNKTFSQLTEWLGFNTPDSGPVPAVQAIDDVDNAAFAVENPDNLDKLNAYCHQISNHQYINPYYPLNRLWMKLSIVGLNFDLKSVLLTGNHGRIELPLTQWGGRFGVLGGPLDHYVGKDDGISNRLPGGLKLVITYQKVNGIYTLDAQLERGEQPHSFVGESEDLQELEATSSAAHLNAAKMHDAAALHSKSASKMIDRPYKDAVEASNATKNPEISKFIQSNSMGPYNAYIPAVGSRERFHTQLANMHRAAASKN